MKIILIAVLACALLAVTYAANFDRYHGELHEVWKLLDSLENRLKSQKQSNIDKATAAKTKYDNAVKSRDAFDAAMKQRQLEHTTAVNEETAARNRYNAAVARRTQEQGNRNAMYEMDLVKEKARGIAEGHYTGAESAFASLSRKTADELALLAMVRNLMNGIHQHPPCVAQEGATKADFNGNAYCYKAFVGVKIDQDVAQARCQAEFKGNLASVHSSQENSFLLQLCKGQIQWLGATDADKEGHWRNFDGSAFDYKNWAAGEPNNHKDIYAGNGAFRTGEHALEEYGNGQWNDMPGKINSLAPNNGGNPTCFVCKRLA